MKTVLLLTDFSQHSRQSLKAVIKMIAHSGDRGRIILLNNYQHYYQLDLSHRGLDLQAQEARKLCEGLGIDIDTLSFQGHLDHFMPELIEEEDVDMLALGLDPKKNAEATQILIQQEHCPLLITHHAS